MTEACKNRMKHFKVTNVTFCKVKDDRFGNVKITDVKEKLCQVMILQKLLVSNLALKSLGL